MFAATSHHEADLFDGTTALAASAPISLHGPWPRLWRHHMRNMRQALKRVTRYGDVEQAASDTDLRFCILHFRQGLQTILDERAEQKKKHTVDSTRLPQALYRGR